MGFMNGRNQDSAYIHGQSGWQELKHMCTGMLGLEPCILGPMENVLISVVFVIDGEMLLTLRTEAQAKSSGSSRKNR